MGRFWSLLFLLVPVLGTAIMVCALMSGTAPLLDHWLPEDVSAYNGAITDQLFYFILWLTGAIFIATGIVLFVFMWKYDSTNNNEPVKFIHGNHTLEVIWSILPAAVLLFIAIFQMDAWADTKMRYPMLAGPDGKLKTEDDVPRPPHALVTARQFEWRIQYPGKDGILETADDVFTVNDLHVPVGEPIVVQIESQDVLHSFFLPNLRIKQDIVPGMRQFVWFKTVKEGTFDIVCAELCGWGHYKMKGRLIIESPAEYRQWLVDTLLEQERTTLPQAEENVDE